MTGTWNEMIEHTENAERGMDRILVIDDDRELCELLVEYLGQEGFEVEVAHTGEDGLKMMSGKPFSLVVLDIMLPGGRNGFDILQRIRARSDTPVIMLTARGDDVDRIVGLEMGADDYHPKPFNPRELLARIRAILRRSRNAPADDPALASRKHRVGDVELDWYSRVVLRGGEAVRLTSVEFHILDVLLRNYGRVVSRDDMAVEVLNRNLSAIDRSIDVHVSNLRKKLGPDPSGGERIKAIRGAGYIYVSSSPHGGGNGGTRDTEPPGEGFPHAEV